MFKKIFLAMNSKKKYFDDTLIRFNDFNHILLFKKCLEQISVLPFTYKVTKKINLNFLDVKLIIEFNRKIQTCIKMKTITNTYLIISIIKHFFIKHAPLCYFSVFDCR